MRIMQLSSPRQADIDSLIELMRQLNGKAPKPEGIVASTACNHVFVARHAVDRKIIGMITVALAQRMDLTQAIIQDFVVHEANRRQGVGRALMEHAIRFARTACAERCELFTNYVKNPGACALYESFGFELKHDHVRYLLAL
jgi:GNAT superfamily N-acetyltransferase